MSDRYKYLVRQDKRTSDRAKEKSREGLTRAIFQNRPEMGTVNIRRGANKAGPWRKVSLSY